MVNKGCFDTLVRKFHKFGRDDEGNQNIVLRQKVINRLGVSSSCNLGNFGVVHPLAVLLCRPFLLLVEKIDRFYEVVDIELVVPIISRFNAGCEL